jgi:multiple antibiotic resistance protein
VRVILIRSVSKGKGMNEFLLCFIPLFVAMDPPGILPIFFRLTAGCTSAQRKKLVMLAIPSATLIGLTFFIAGRPILDFLHIKVFDLQIAGGILLFLYALMDLVIPGKPAVSPSSPAAQEDAPGIVPLATPIIVGPAVMTLGLVMVDKYGLAMTSTALIANILILLAIMLASDLILRIVPMQAMNAASKVIDLLLAAIGVMLVREGIVALLAHLHAQPAIAG